MQRVPQAETSVSLMNDKFVRSDYGLRSFQALNQLVSLTVFSDRDDGLIYCCSLVSFSE